ncbi:MAG TPA: hypothetical protein VJK05_04625 [archaeon]|nr:hypothetical protein [archaeon]
MGSFIELNDTLQITKEQGFPVDILDLKTHRKNPIKLEEVKDKIFEFHDKAKARIYHHSPVRCFLVQNIEGKWIYWGTILILEQTIKGDSKENHSTSGKYKIIQIYEPGFQEQITKIECGKELSYF